MFNCFINTSDLYMSIEVFYRVFTTCSLCDNLYCKRIAVFIFLLVQENSVIRYILNITFQQWTQEGSAFRKYCAIFMEIHYKQIKCYLPRTTFYKFNYFVDYLIYLSVCEHVNVAQVKRGK